MKKGKKYQDSVKLIEKGKFYETAEALELVGQTAKAKFDETVEIHVRLGVDSRHADQQVRGAVVLPNGTGKETRVLVLVVRARLMKQRLQVLTLLVLKIWFRRFSQKTGLILT